MTIRDEIAGLEENFRSLEESFRSARFAFEKLLPLLEETNMRKSLMLEELCDLRNLNSEWLTAMHFGWCCLPEAESIDSDPMGDMMGRNV